SETELLQLTASAEKGSEHPLGEAIVKDAEDKGLDFMKVENFAAITGHGIEVKVDGKTVLAGNKKLISVRNISLSKLSDTYDELTRQGKTQMYIDINNKNACIITVAYTIYE